jgi:hypothetical protein
MAAATFVDLSHTNSEKDGKFLSGWGLLGKSLQYNCSTDSMSTVIYNVT